MLTEDLATEWALFEEKLSAEAISSHPLLQQMAHYLVTAGGKKLRPYLAFLCAYLCEYTGWAHVPFAQALEYIHVASLLHDDVLDHGQERREQPCFHHVWDSSQAILVGDLLLTKSMSLLIDIGQWDLMRLVQQMTHALLEGQIKEKYISWATSPDEYLDMIQKKTAIFFAVSCQGVGLLAHINMPRQQALYTYGLLLGMSYQLMDDIADYQLPLEKWGTGHDFIEKKITFPLLLAYHRGSLELKEALIYGAPSELLLQQLYPYFEETRAYAQNYSQKARDLILCHWPKEKLSLLLEFQAQHFPFQSSLEKDNPIFLN